MLTYQRLIPILIVLLLATPQLLSAQDDVDRWFARFAAGSTRLHEYNDQSAWFESRVGRGFGRQFVSLDVGFAGCAAGFGSLTSGLEFKPIPQARVSPYARVEAGVLGESDFGGGVYGIGAGIALRLQPRAGLRFGTALNSHGGQRGPVSFYGGFEFRW